MMTLLLTRRPCFLLLLLIPCEAFTIAPHFSSQKSSIASSSSTASPSALYDNNNNDNDNNDNVYADNREKVRVPRRGRRRRRQYEEEDLYEEEYETTEEQERPYYDDDDEEYYDDDDDDEYEEVDYEYEEETSPKSEYDRDLLIPNSLLDQVDPEGAGERFGEIAKDPVFWRDVLIAVAVFNFCEYVAQVPFMEGPYY